MPLPLVWLGAGVAALVAGNHLAKEYDRSKGVIGSFPGEKKDVVAPVDGAIVCCGIYQVFEHTGIWIEDHIVELKGNGLIRGISPQRFLDNRSGEKIFIACDSEGSPLTDNNAMHRASERLYEYADYHLLKNNCHRFVSECLTGQSADITSFTDFNHILFAHFDTSIHWFPAKISTLV
jgi:hypothetical protein